MVAFKPSAEVVLVGARRLAGSVEDGTAWGCRARSGIEGFSADDMVNVLAELVE